MAGQKKTTLADKFGVTIERDEFEELQELFALRLQIIENVMDFHRARAAADINVIVADAKIIEAYIISPIEVPLV